MNKFIANKSFIAFVFLSVGSTLLTKAQLSSSLGVWVDHLPYTVGVDMVQRNNAIYAATEQGIFIFNTVDRDIQRLSKVNGLSDIAITELAYSNEYDIIIVGYQNGNIDIINSDRVDNYPDIRFTSNYSGLKRINHIMIRSNIAYIATDFGIVSFDLSQRIFRDTFIIGEHGNTLKVFQTAVNEDSIYAVTDKGLYRAALGEGLIFFKNWRRDISKGKFIDMITVFDGKVFINKTDNNDSNNDSIFYRDNNSWKHFNAAMISNNLKLETGREILLVINPFSVIGYNSDFSIVYNVNSVHLDYEDFFPKAALVDPNPEAFWILDHRRGLFLNYQVFTNQNFDPNGPATKNVYSMHFAGGKVYVSPGSVSPSWAPGYNNDGFFILNDFEWKNVSNSNFGEYKDIVSIASNPQDLNHFYVSSYGNGILEFRNDEFVELINETSTSGAMPSMNQGRAEHRVGELTFDKEGNCWFTNSLTDKLLGVIRKDGTVESFNLGSAAPIGSPIKDIMYTSQDQIWIQMRGSGITVVKFNNNHLLAKKLTSVENSGNLPSQTVLCFTEDQDGEIWIGTLEGVGVLYNPQNIFEPNRNFDVARILIDEDGDGFGTPFLEGESINDIEIDGANKKWFATTTAGVFYTDETGAEEIYHFTQDNSPLLSNNVLEIEIDDNTGMVHFGTDQGIVSFQGNATEGGEFHRDVFAYPNPVKPGYEGPILIRGLVTNAQVKITNIEGNLIYETGAEGGQAIWNGKNFSGERARSGVYIAYITDDLGTNTAVVKILIIN